MALVTKSETSGSTGSRTTAGSAQLCLHLDSEEESVMGDGAIEDEYELDWCAKATEYYLLDREGVSNETTFEIEEEYEFELVQPSRSSQDWGSCLAGLARLVALLC
ncbi:unnamed protein product [Durusdinium trenchii]|uniref:Uncharacterized protein n=2 Tax=Durusdinium trenchii TaxID=1381693 RepID=A0ABP0N136_9DINO